MSVKYFNASATASLSPSLNFLGKSETFLLFAVCKHVYKARFADVGLAANGNYRLLRAYELLS